MCADFVNIHEAKTNLSRLLQRVEAGEEIIIARAGKPIGKLSRYAQAPLEKREPGIMKGKVWYAPDWDSPETNAEIANMFYDSLGVGDDPPSG